MRHQDAIAAFRRDFTIKVARTPGEMREAFQLRHQVYCLERGYEEATAAGVEQDEFDGRAKHIIACDRRSGQVVGTVRLILPGRDRSRDSMPMRRLCDPALLRHIPYASTAEVSRFAVSKVLRESGAGDSLLRLGLVQGSVRVSREMGLTHWCAIMERSLLRLLRATAIRFDPVGPAVEHHGLRQPCVAHIGTVLADMETEQPGLWDLVTDGGLHWWDQPERMAA